MRKESILPKFNYKAKYGRLYTHEVCKDCSRKYLCDNMIQDKINYELWLCLKCYNFRNKDRRENGIN
jgi:hypothetical protein